MLPVTCRLPYIHLCIGKALVQLTDCTAGVAKDWNSWNFTWHSQLYSCVAALIGIVSDHTLMWVCHCCHFTPTQLEQNPKQRCLIDLKKIMWYVFVIMSICLSLGWIKNVNDLCSIRQVPARVYFILFIYPVKSLQGGDLAMTATQNVEDKTIQNKETAKIKYKKTGNSTKTAKII